MFSGADQEINFAGRHQLAVDGGYLIVHGTEPAIIGGDTDRASALTELQLIVSTTMTRYAGKLDHWIVVNEPLSPTGFRKCRWLSTIGPDYVAEAFRAARQADPDAILVLNEDGLEDDSGTQKRATMLQLLATLKNGGVPLDALGLQAHLNPAHRIDRDVLNDFLSQVTSLGLKVIITELDVFDVSLPADESARDAMVAQHIGDFLEIVLPHPSLFAVNVWGLSDKYSWYNSPRTPAVLRRSDSLPSRGTLLDEQLNRKPAYYAVRRAFENSERS